jgi:hypothetical protein
VPPVEPTPAPSRSGVLTARAWPERQAGAPVRIRVTYGVDGPDGTPAGPPRTVVVATREAFLEVVDHWYGDLLEPAVPGPDEVSA